MRCDDYLSDGPDCAKSGFTLIELSITLVIIALIVGGILIGRDLISKTRLNAIVTEAQQLKSAVVTFKAQYGYLPGDMPNATSIWTTAAAWGGGNNGDGDGSIAL